jgi:hypothetical protein
MRPAPPPSARQTRDAAEAALAAGNPIESVAKVFGVPVETLQDWVRQRPEDVPGEPRHEPERPWLRFPGTVIYPSGLAADASGWLLVAIVTAFPVLAWMGVRLFPHRWEALAASALVSVASIAALVQMIRSMRTCRVEMRHSEIARYDLKGCTVLPYAEIIGLTAGLLRGVYSIEFLTSSGKALTIYPTFEQLEDERLWRWLKSIPQRSGYPLRRPSDEPGSGF